MRRLACLFLACLSAFDALAGEQGRSPAGDAFQEGWYRQNALRDFTAAIACYESVAADHGAPAELAGRAWLGKGECLEALGRLEEACECYRQAGRLLPRPEADVRKLVERIRRLEVPTTGEAVREEPPVTVFVEAILPEGPVARLAFEAGDILLAYDGQPVASVKRLGQSFAATRGRREEVPVTVLRDGQERSLSLPGGEAGVRFAQSAGRGTPFQLETTNFREIRSASVAKEPFRQASRLKEAAGRKDLTTVEQAFLVDMARHLRPEDAEDALEALLENKALTEATRGHLSARRGEMPPRIARMIDAPR